MHYVLVIQERELNPIDHYINGKSFVNLLNTNTTEDIGLSIPKINSTKENLALEY